MKKQRKQTIAKSDKLRVNHEQMEPPPVSEIELESLHTTYSSSRVKCSARQFPTQTDPDQMQDVSVTNSLVYPLYFNPDDIKSIDSLPLLTDLTPVDSVRTLGELLQITDYEFNYSSFWNVDTLAGLLREAQHQGFTEICQRRIIEWFDFVVKKISIEGCTRDDLFKTLEDMFLKAGIAIVEGNNIPSPKQIKIIATHEVGDNKSEEIRAISLNSHKIDEENGRPHVANTSKPPSEEMLVKRKRKKSQSSPMISTTTLQKKLHSSSADVRVQRKVSSSKKRRRSMSMPAVCITDGDIVDNAETGGSDTELETSKRFSELMFLVKKIYAVFADEFKFSLIKLACHEPASVTPVEVCHTFKVPKLLKPASSTLEQPPLSPKGKMDKGKKDKKAKKGKKGRSKSSVPQADDKVTEADKGSKKDKNKRSSSKVGKRTKSPEEKVDSAEDKMREVSVPGVTKLQMAMSEPQVTPEQHAELERWCTKDKYILPLADAVDSSFFEKIFYVKPQKVENDDTKTGKTKKDEKGKGKNKHDKSKKKKEK